MKEKPTFKSLMQEFTDLRLKYFGSGAMFVIFNPEDEKRYGQLMAFFDPRLRYDGWKNPMKEG